MCKKLLYIAVPALLMLCACSKDNNERSYGKIHMIYKDHVLKDKFYYNEKAQLIRHVYYNYGNGTRTDSFFYNASDQRVKMSAFIKFPGSSPNYSYEEYLYDADGRMKERLAYNKNSNSSYIRSARIVNAYDAGRRLISSSSYYIHDSLATTVSFQYNSAGNITVQEQYGYVRGAWKLWGRYIYDAFDDKKNPFAEAGIGVPPQTINPNNMLHSTYVSTVPVIDDLYDASTQTTILSYNNKGLPVELIENGDNLRYQYD